VRSTKTIVSLSNTRPLPNPGDYHAPKTVPSLESHYNVVAMSSHHAIWLQCHKKNIKNKGNPDLPCLAWMLSPTDHKIGPFDHGT
jgi:hypothetical protein